jgi:Tol biopolymer transport system component
MKPILISIILAIFLAIGSINTSIAQSPEQLYQKGLGKEEGEGALQDAINLYNQVADNSNASISLQAKALLHIGMCYEKLGMQEAVKAYQRLVSNFPTQKNEVAYARERLNKLVQLMAVDQKVPLIPKFTKIKMPINPGNGVLSPDGKRLAFIFDGYVWTIPVSGVVDPYIAGEPKKLTDNIGAWDNSNSFAWSGDGKWIAVNAELKSSSTSIYVIPSEGGKPQKVQVPSHQCGFPTEFRLSLSPDGKILAYTSGFKAGDYQTKSTHIYIIPVSGGTPKELTEPGTQEPSFSPDGSKIVYVKYTKNNAGQYHSDLCVIPSEGGTPIQVTSMQSLQVFGPSWSPDGKMITFIRRPTYNDPKEIWIVPVTDKGIPSAAPIKIDLPLASYHEVAGWTSDNKIGLQLMNPEYEIIYTVNSSGGIATQVTPQGWTEYPKLSPDGKKIFFRGDRGKIVYVPSGGGAIDSISIQSEFEMFAAAPGSGNDISPDGKTIVFSGARYFYKDGEKNGT